MTVVVARPGLMCADSQVTGETVSKTSKMYHMPGGYAVGFAGDMCAWQRLVELSEWPRKPSVKTLVSFVNTYVKTVAPGPDDAGTDFVVCTPDEVFEVSGGSVMLVDVGVVGSGESVARGYLWAKPGDIEGAVAAAIALCPGCGGPAVTALTRGKSRAKIVAR